MSEQFNNEEVTVTLTLDNDETLECAVLTIYEVDGKVYFGELTFTPTGCLGTYYTEQADLELGEILDVNWRG